jgi:hypothetical protein
VAQAAGIHLWLREYLALGDDLRHRRMVLWEPVGRTIPIGDLRAGEREFRPGEVSRCPAPAAEWAPPVEFRAAPAL